MSSRRAVRLRLWHWPALILSLTLETLKASSWLYGSFRKSGVPYFGVLIIRILVFRVLY